MVVRRCEAADVPVELGLRVDTLIDADIVGIRKGGSADGVVAVDREIGDVEFAANERPKKARWTEALTP